MASWIIHLRIADLLLGRIGALDETAFVVGNIAPDSGVPDEGWASYRPPKTVSHYRTADAFCDYGQFIAEHFTPGMIRAYSRREFSFFLGYYVHLLTDGEWFRLIYRPVMDELTGNRGMTREEAIRAMKQDWYGLDFRYLEAHPGFRAFRLYEQAAGFRNDFMDAFSPDAFDLRREYICAFYRGAHGETDREYPYLSPGRADRFVKETADAVMDTLQAPLAVRGEAPAYRLDELQPSQFCISEKKLRAVREWFDPACLSGFEPIPVKLLDGVPVMTDGHTRAACALLSGIGSVPLAWDPDDLDWDAYRACVAECRKRQVLSAADLTRHIVPEAEYAEIWDRWCDALHAGLEKGRAQERPQP